MSLRAVVAMSSAAAAAPDVSVIFFHRTPEVSVSPKIWEDPGSWEDPVRSSTPKTPASPDLPSKILV
jgi:hypothetical protein